MFSRATVIPEPSAASFHRADRWLIVSTESSERSEARASRAFESEKSDMRRTCIRGIDHPGLELGGFRLHSGGELFSGADVGSGVSFVRHTVGIGPTGMTCARTLAYPAQGLSLVSSKRSGRGADPVRGRVSTLVMTSDLGMLGNHAFSPASLFRARPSSRLDSKARGKRARTRCDQEFRRAVVRCPGCAQPVARREVRARPKGESARVRPLTILETRFPDVWRTGEFAS